VVQTSFFNVVGTVSDVEWNSTNQPANFSARKVKHVECSFIVTATLEVAMSKAFTSLGVLFA